LAALFLANGILGIPILLTYFVDPAFIYVAALWGVTVSGSSILLAVSFRRQKIGAAAPEMARPAGWDGEGAS